jgi:hypothetical protein
MEDRADMDQRQLRHRYPISREIPIIARLTRKFVA